ncbi:MAG: major capsid protein, partial [Candidatus Spyradocola sp.]
IFTTDDVLVEFRDGTKKLAPFVAPRKGGVTMLRNGYNMQRYTPPFIAPKRTLTLDELKKRGFGEALYANLTPEQRQQILILRDAEELSDLITRREEAMAAETMLTNGCVMKHIADDADKSDEMEIRFYAEASNPASYTPTTKWDATGANILADLAAMARLLTSKGLAAADLVCSPDVADTIVNDDGIQKLLDNKRYELGMVEPAMLPDGAAIVASLNVNGRIISVISYDETYTDDTGADKLFIPSGKCILTAPGAGRTLYGAVTQVEQSDGEFHTYAGRRVPKYLSNAEGNTRSLTISSRPLMIPNNKNPFIVASVLSE